MKREEVSSSGYKVFSGTDARDAVYGFAVKEHGGAEGAYAYLQQMWDDHAADAEHDAMQGAHGDTYDNQWFQRPNPWK